METLVERFAHEAYQPILQLVRLYSYGCLLEAEVSSIPSDAYEGLLSENEGSISEPTLESDGNEVLLVDDHATHPRMIRHFPGKGFHVIQPYDVSHNTPIKYTQDLVIFPYGADLQCVRFAPVAATLLSDYIPKVPSLFAFLYGSSQSGTSQLLGICDAARACDIIPLFSGEPHPSITGFFWISPLWVPQTEEQEPLLDLSDQLLVVIASDGLRLFLVDGKDATILQSILDVPLVRHAWWEELSTTVVLEVGHGILQPYHFNTSVLRFEPAASFDLELPKWHSLAVSEVSVMCLYDVTYCLHSDPANGRLHIRNLVDSQNAQLTIDLKSPGEMLLQRVDNMIIIHRPDRAESYVFDILEFSEHTITSETSDATSNYVSFSLRLSFPKEDDKLDNGGELDRINTVDDAAMRNPFDTTQYPEAWDLRSTNGLIVHRTHCIVYFLRVNLGATVIQLLKKQNRPVSSITEFLLRRQDAYDALLLVATWDFEIACGRQTFAKLANAYRQAIDCVTAADVLTARHTPNTPQRFAALQTASSLFPFRKSKFWTSASFVLLQKYKRCNRLSILTELDLTANVFYRSLSKTFGLPPGTSLLALSVQQFAAARTSSAWANNLEASETFILTLLNSALRYTRCLLDQNIHPHRTLRVFLFDLCVFANDESSLQQMFQFNVISECPDIQKRILDLCNHRQHSPWLNQLALDVSARLKDWTMVATLLLERKMYHKVASLLRERSLFDFPLHRFLKAVSEDVHAQQDDPELFPDILAAIRHWIISSAVPPAESPEGNSGSLCNSLPSYSSIRCNITNCEQWLLDLPTR